MRLLLINPRSPESFWSFRWAVDEILPRKRAVNLLAQLDPSRCFVPVNEALQPLAVKCRDQVFGIP